MLFVDALRAQGVGDDDRVELPAFDPLERKRLDGLFGPCRDKSWTGLNLKIRVDAIEHLWTEERRTEFHRFAHRDNNQTLHLARHAAWTLS